MQGCIANKSHRKVQTWCTDPSLNTMRLQPQMLCQLVMKITFSLLIPISSSLQQIQCNTDIGHLTRLIVEALLDELDKRAVSMELVAGFQLLIHHLRKLLTLLQFSAND